MIFSTNTLITLLQALQLVALAPCLFVILFLVITAHERRLILVPCLYFTALASSFIIPLLAIWPMFNGDSDQAMFTRGGLIFIQSLLPALSFLLIIQFAIGKTPRPLYWAILALPLLGGSGVVYAAMLSDELCIGEWGCISSQAVEGLYSTFSNALIFLLLVVMFAHARKDTNRESFQSRNRYWLIVALIGLNLILMALDLLHIAGVMHPADALFATTLLRMTFIYVVLTLLFRVFDRRAMVREATEAREPSKKPASDEKDLALVKGFEVLMQEKQIYREMECSRETVANALGINENMLSRIINQHYKLRFTDVVNQYRVKEAQRLLVANPDQAITDIAFEVGFNSIPSFNRVFKESCGFSPTEYRNTRLLPHKKG
ncbi:MAG: helix-turn-helix domain-containing protein [Alphaproteobacteria bacterium]|nr:helix-turn-helix domain-containing protein [Alphaproteobacteria bacterium]